jgi:hypothetical protein
MALSIAAYTGSEAVTTTEWSLTTDSAGPDSDTTDGCFQPFIVIPAAATFSDLFRIAYYETVSGTQYKIFEADVRGSGVAECWVGPAMTLGVGWDMTIIKTSGTDRTIVWHINKVT